jgi:hypothetical protein
MRLEKSYFEEKKEDGEDAEFSSQTSFYPLVILINPER